jgi:hypothetical protein
MRKTSHFTDAFVDESIRGQRYLLCCSLVHAQNIPAIRHQIEKTQFKGRRIHFNSANTAIKRNFLNMLKMPQRNHYWWSAISTIGRICFKLVTKLLQSWYLYFKDEKSSGS